MSMPTEIYGLHAATFPPELIEGYTLRRNGFPQGVSDTNVNKFRRFVKETLPDFDFTKGIGFHHKVLKTGEAPVDVEGGSVVTNILYDTIPPFPLLDGKAFHHKVFYFTTPPPPVEGGSVVTNILYDTIPPFPLLDGRIYRDSRGNIHHVTPPTDVGVDKFKRFVREEIFDPDSINGKAFHHKIFHVEPPPPSVDRIVKNRLSREPEPDLVSLFRTQTTQRRLGSPAPVVFVEFTHFYESSYRVADATLDLFQLFIGEDAEPDFSAPPADTSATLPFSFAITPPGAGTKTINAVVRKQNAFGLASFNIFKTSFVIDTSGNEVLGPISPPIIVNLFNSKIGKVIALCQYVGNDINPADSWEIYAKEGSDPVPGVDTPILISQMVYISSVAAITARLGTFTPGVILHVIATAIRTVDDERGNSGVSQITLNLSPDLNEGAAFGGDLKELR